MANIPLVGAGGWFVAAGHEFGGSADIIALAGGQATARVLSTSSFVTRKNQIFTDYAAQTPNHDYLLTNMANEFTQWLNAQNTFLQAMSAEAQSLLITMANDSVALPKKTLANAMALLVTQMQGSSDAIAAVTISAGAQAAMSGVTNVGNGKVISSIVGPDGKNFQYTYPETVTFDCSSDSYTGGVTVNNETFLVSGQNLITNTWQYNWPGGSGKSTTLTCVDPTQSNAGGNFLYNSDFETFTAAANYPNNWVIAVGTAGTQVFQGAVGVSYTGAACLQLTGSGGVSTSLTQTFNTTPSNTAGAGGTNATLLPRTPYAVGIWTRVITGAPAAGVLTIDLIDGSGNVTADDAGTNNSFTIDLTLETTTYAFHSGVFRLPSAPPSTVKLRIRTSTPITNTNSICIDHVSFSQMTQLYVGGPYFSITSGSTPWVNQAVIGDAFTVLISNNYGAATQPGWAGYLQRSCNMLSLGLTVPFASGGSITVANSLIS